MTGCSGDADYAAHSLKAVPPKREATEADCAGIFRKSGVPSRLRASKTPHSKSSGINPLLDKARLMDEIVASG